MQKYSISDGRRTRALMALMPLPLIEIGAEIDLSWEDLEDLEDVKDNVFV